MMSTHLQLCGEEINTKPVVVQEVNQQESHTLSLANPSPFKTASYPLAPFLPLSHFHPIRENSLEVDTPRNRIGEGNEDTFAAGHLDSKVLEL